MPVCDLPLVSPSNQGPIFALFQRSRKLSMKWYSGCASRGVVQQSQQAACIESSFDEGARAQNHSFTMTRFYCFTNHKIKKEPEKP